MYNGPLECRDKVYLKIVSEDIVVPLFFWIWKDAVDLKMFELLEYSKDTVVLQMNWNSLE